MYPKVRDKYLSGFEKADIFKGPVPKSDVVVCRNLAIYHEKDPEALKTIYENLNKSVTSPVSIIDGEHYAKGKGKVTGIDVQEPVFMKPGTKSIAEGEGNITATRISYNKRNRNESGIIFWLQVSEVWFEVRYRSDSRFRRSSLSKLWY